MAKITTEVCKHELNKRWAVEGKKSPNDWKRLSKSGNASTGIVRLFQHLNLPIFATVVEEHGAITKVTFADSLNPSRPSKPAGSKTKRSAPATTNEDATANSAVREPGQPASNGKVSADQFLFAVCERNNRRTTFAICSKEYWHANHHLSDTTFGGLLDGLLPPGCYESSESQFSDKMGRQQLYEFLLAQGFCDDERFTSYMDGYQPRD